jgi:Transglycosylase
MPGCSTAWGNARRWLLDAAMAAIAVGAVLVVATEDEEIGLGVKLSLQYSKQQILDMYLNVVYYGHGYWGDVAAARGYFGETPYTLDWARRRCSRACRRRLRHRTPSSIWSCRRSASATS